MSDVDHTKREESRGGGVSWTILWVRWSPFCSSHVGGEVGGVVHLHGMRLRTSSLVACLEGTRYYSRAVYHILQMFVAGVDAYTPSTGTE